MPATGSRHHSVAAEPARARLLTMSSPPPIPAGSCSPLVSYALDGLRRCWMPEHGRYSHRYRFDAPPGNESVPASDVFYTLNVLLAYTRLPPGVAGEHGNLTAIYDRCCGEARNLKLQTYAYGMALWTGAALGTTPPGWLTDHVLTLLASDRRRLSLTAQDAGMLTSGCAAMAEAQGGIWTGAAAGLAEHLRRHHYEPRSQLFYNSGAGWRRVFASFAAQIYPALALYQYGETFGADWAVRMADSSAARLIALQGRQGEWPWFFHVPSGRVVDFYEIYSVHQHGMAPALLHHAVRHRVPGARDALVRGFGWLFGNNEMGVSMLRPAERMFYRSQLRRGEASPWQRAVRSLANLALGRSDAPQRHCGLRLRQECRSYELGWLLWSFGGRGDYPELTHRCEFAAALATANEL
jgi:hypothetical protein